MSLQSEQLGDLLQAFRYLAGYFSARRQDLLNGRERLATLIDIVRQEFGNSGQSRLPVEQQHEELFADQHLELRKRNPRGYISIAKRAQRLETALVDHAA